MDAFSEWEPQMTRTLGRLANASTRRYAVLAILITCTLSTTALAQTPASTDVRSLDALSSRVKIGEAVVVTDKEATNNVIQVLYPVTANKVVRTLSDYRHPDGLKRVR